MHSPTELVDVFRASGRKMTPQRECIFQVMYENPRHPTAEAIHAEVIEQMPSVSLRTVYATLHDLAEMGELRLLDLGTGSTRFDPNTADHHHLVCEVCAAVYDVGAEAPDVSRAVKLDFGFAVESTEIVFRGRCRHCQTADTPPHLFNSHNTRSNTHG